MNNVWMDPTLLISKISMNKKNDGKSEGINYIIIIYHDFLTTPRRGSHVKSGKTHTPLSRYTP